MLTREQWEEEHPEPTRGDIDRRRFSITARLLALRESNAAGARVDECLALVEESRFLREVVAEADRVEAQLTVT